MGFAEKEGFLSLKRKSEGWWNTNSSSGTVSNDEWLTPLFTVRCGHTEALSQTVSLKHDGTANTDGTAVERADGTTNTGVN